MSANHDSDAAPAGYVLYDPKQVRAFSKSAVAGLVTNIVAAVVALGFVFAFAYRWRALDAYFGGTGPIDDVRTGDSIVRVLLFCSIASAIAWAAAVIAWSKQAMAMMGITSPDRAERRKRFKALVKADPVTWRKYQRWLVTCWVSLVCSFAVNVLPTKSTANTLAGLESNERRGIVVHLVFAAFDIAIAVLAWQAKLAVEATARARR